ncbi:presenilin-like protein At1g08700 [Euphorbia lathyris]|uniref:presenilin-like protein At1g08700 n=1 Tax=Euphorbia lathyris TaxID=212925 RepID=UPI00331406F0
MESSILESIGIEIIDVMSPVSICMLLVVLIVYSLSPSNPFSAAASAPPIRTAANLVYLENPSDSTVQKLEGSLLNALVFVIIVALVTFLLVLLYYYNCTNFLKNYMRFSAFFVLGSMGGSIFLSLIQQFSIPVDSITCFIMLFNFTIVGVLSVFAGGIPIFLRQGYMVALGIFVAAWFTKLPEWTTWTLLVALAVYDLVAVLAPGGPLKLLVELAQSRDEELPALVYEARPTVSQDMNNQGRSLDLLVGGVSDSRSVEMQAVSNNIINHNGSENRNFRNVEGSRNRDDIERSPLVVFSQGRRSSSSESSEYSTVVNSRASDIVADEERSPLVDMLAMETEREEIRRDSSENSVLASRGIKLGLGDFIFYSVLVGRAAMYDLMTVYACYLAIISGLGCTLILLSLCRQALPALPISIALGVIFYFLTRLLMEPFIVGTATNLMMF